MATVTFRVDRSYIRMVPGPKLPTTLSPPGLERNPARRHVPQVDRLVFGSSSEGLPVRAERGTEGERAPV